MSIREISRRTGLAGNTVKKHLRSEESEPKYRKRINSGKLDGYAEKLATGFDGKLGSDFRGIQKMLL